MSDNWIVQNLNSALQTWSDKLAEIWTLLTQSPENFEGWGDLERDDEHQRWTESHRVRPAGSVLCGRAR